MEDLVFHHIGVATKNLERELKAFEILGYKPVSDVFVDPIQKIKGIFVSSPYGPCLEILENAFPDGPLNSFLSQGIKLYHFAYKTLDIEKDVNRLVADGAMIIVPITKATYFEKICFMILRNKMIVELVQEKN